MAKLSPIAYGILLARLVVAGTFIWAALPKIQDPVAFTTAVTGFQVVSGPLAAWVGIALPWLELVIGLGLLVPTLRRGSGWITALLLIAFIGLHASAWMRGLNIDCGCFGESSSETPPNYFLLIIRNLALLAACTVVLIRDHASSVSWAKPSSVS